MLCYGWPEEPTVELGSARDVGEHQLQVDGPDDICTAATVSGVYAAAVAATVSGSSNRSHMILGRKQRKMKMKNEKTKKMKKRMNGCMK